eukprot:g9637.t1
MTPTPNGSDYAKSRHFLRFRCSSAVEQVEEANEATATSATRQKLLHKQDEQGLFFNLQKNSVLPGAHHQSGDDADGVVEMGGDANGSAAAGGTSSSTLALRAELLKADQLYESFVSRVRCFGVHHFSVAICLEELGKKMNSAALAKLEAGNVVEARTLLLLAEKQMHAIGKQFYDHLKNAAVVPRQTDNYEKNSDHRNNRRPRRTFRQAFALFASLTLNNLASLERGSGGKDVKENGVDEQEVQKDLEKALAYLEASKMWVPELPAADAAVTYLNLSAVLSELGRHKEAEKAAMNAVRRSEQDIMCLHRTTPQEYGEKVASLAVAYNNWAVQKELLASTSASTTTATPSPAAAACCPEEAISLYQKALHLANNHLEEGHPLRQKFQLSQTMQETKTMRGLRMRKKTTLAQRMIKTKRLQIVKAQRGCRACCTPA